MVFPRTLKVSMVGAVLMDTVRGSSDGGSAVRALS